VQFGERTVAFGRLESLVRALGEHKGFKQSLLPCDEKMQERVAPAGAIGAGVCLEFSRCRLLP